MKKFTKQFLRFKGHRPTSKWAAVFFAVLMLASAVKAVSLAELAQDLRQDSRFYMVSLETIIANFGTDANKETYNDIKKKYVSAVGFYYERDFAEAYRLYTEIQQSIETLAEDLSLKYIERSQKMLIDFSSKIIDLETKYDKNSELAKTLKANRVSYFNEEKKKELMSSRFYNPKIVHYTYDRYSILDNLAYGFGNLGTAKEAREKAQSMDKYLGKEQKPYPRLRDKKIRAYLASIERCRDAKANAIRMLQLYNRNDEYTVQGNVTFNPENKEFKENPFLVEHSLDPVFDPRIPQEYRIDAEDVRDRNYQEQVDMKLNGKAFGDENFDENKQKQGETNSQNSSGQSQ